MLGEICQWSRVLPAFWGGTDTGTPWWVWGAPWNARGDYATTWSTHFLWISLPSLTTDWRRVCWGVRGVGRNCVIAISVPVHTSWVAVDPCLDSGKAWGIWFIMGQVTQLGLSSRHLFSRATDQWLLSPESCSAISKPWRHGYIYTHPGKAASSEVLSVWKRGGCHWQLTGLSGFLGVVMSGQLFLPDSSSSCLICL